MQDIPVYLNHLGIVCSLGRGAEQVWQTLQQPDAEPLTLADEWMSTPVYVGRSRLNCPRWRNLQPSASPAITSY
tara:strand:- start:19892 stop:20113 length:222 start_codon:yes stop_codon:yes gene_type:complete